jgi:hypothetical protein
LFDELKDGIEQMRWVNEDEARSHAREIESLKAEVKRQSLLREESLESQRRDLTKTFEGILQQREEAFTNKEREIAGQIMLLDTRLEQLLTENTRLKNELGSSQRKAEQYVEELAAKEEARRQLQWQLDDEKANQTQANNAQAHKLQQATLELSLYKENATKDILTLKKAITQVNLSF